MKKISVKFDINFICNQLLKQQLDALDIEYVISDRGQVIFNTPLTEEQAEILEMNFKEHGMELIKSSSDILVQRIRDAITSFIDSGDFKQYKLSTILSTKLNYSYAHLSNVFSENTFTSIENFLILKKIDHVKSLLVKENLTLTEIAHQLNYSSVAHLSSQFKKTTGLTPTSYQSIMIKRLNYKSSLKLK